MAGLESSKVRVRKVFSGGRQAPPPFIPWLCSHAARVERLPLRKMLSDGPLLARALQNAQKLYGYDAVVNIFDPTIEAEACGCPVIWKDDGELPLVEEHPPIEHLGEDFIARIRERGRLPAVLEATRRLKINLSRTVAIAGVVTGPFTLAGHLSGQDIVDQLRTDSEKAKSVLDLAGKVCLEVCKSYCEIGLDLAVLAESVLPRLPVQHLSLAHSVMKPVVNVMRFYDVIPLLLARGCGKESVEVLKEMDVDGMVVDGGIESDVRQEVGPCVVGTSLPASALKGPKDLLVSQMRDLLGDEKVSFMATEWEVPYDVPPENMREISILTREMRSRPRGT
jgi:uroporphyrinogen decarboxylase